MSIVGSILTVERTLPVDVLAGVLSGQYSVHGGVIRSATGQIVRHLVPAASQALKPFGVIGSVPGVFNTYQLHRLAEMSQQLIMLSSATMAMAGLNLVVSAVGFKILRDSLARVENQLREMDKKLVWIKTFLDTSRRASLLNAAEELSALPADSEHRVHILHASRDALGNVRHQYLQHWEESTDLVEAMAYQHYYCAAFLLRARCSAELGMHEKAVSEFDSDYERWLKLSRHLAVRQILCGKESRFLGREYVATVPVAKVAGWLDFAHGDQRGYEWIDELRKEYEPAWKVPRPWSNASEEHPEEKALGYLDNLVAKDQVLRGYSDQYKFLASHVIKPSEFDVELSALPRDQSAAELLFLAPLETRTIAHQQTNTPLSV